MTAAHTNTFTIALKSDDGISQCLTRPDPAMVTADELKASKRMSEVGAANGRACSAHAVASAAVKSTLFALAWPGVLRVLTFDFVLPAKVRYGRGRSRTFSPLTEADDLETCIRPCQNAESQEPAPVLAPVPPEPTKDPAVLGFSCSPDRC